MSSADPTRFFDSRASSARTASLTGLAEGVNTGGPCAGERDAISRTSPTAAIPVRAMFVSAMTSAPWCRPHPNTLRRVKKVQVLASPGPPDGPHLSARASSAEKPIAAIRLEPRNIHAGRHLEGLEDLARSRIHPS